GGHRGGCEHTQPSCSGLRRARLGAAGGAAARGARRAGALGRGRRHPAAEGADPEGLTGRLPRSRTGGSRAGERRRRPRPRIAGISELRGSTMKGVLASLQKVGGALMLPIAVLPIAGLLLRLGQPDLLDSASMAAAGEAIFNNLGLLFAIGVSVGLARENHGAAGLPSVGAYLGATQGADGLVRVPPGAVAGRRGHARELAVAAYKEPELFKLNVPIGILSGLMGGALYNRFYNISLPSYLAFFGGRRFVPIVSGLGGLVLALAFGTQWQHLQHGMDALSRSALPAGAFGPFAYRVANPRLILNRAHSLIHHSPSLPPTVRQAPTRD